MHGRTLIPHVRPRRGAVRLEAGQGAGYVAKRRADFGAEGCNGHDADHRDQPNKHAVFDQSRAVFFSAEAVYQLAHVHVAFPSERVTDSILGSLPRPAYEKARGRTLEPHVRPRSGPDR
jgi:hypothetical protein